MTFARNVVKIICDEILHGCLGLLYRLFNMPSHRGTVDVDIGTIVKADKAGPYVNLTFVN
jgi:hypothetical protein